MKHASDWCVLCSLMLSSEGVDAPRRHSDGVFTLAAKYFYHKYGDIVIYWSQPMTSVILLLLLGPGKNSAEQLCSLPGSQVMLWSPCLFPGCEPAGSQVENLEEIH